MIISSQIGSVIFNWAVLNSAYSVAYSINLIYDRFWLPPEYGSVRN